MTTSPSFATSGALPNLNHLLPYPATRWRYSSGLEERLKATAPEQNLSYKRCQILPIDKEWDFAMAFFEAQRPTNRVVKKLWAVLNERHTQIFENNIPNIESLGKKLKPDWQTESSNPQRTKIIQRWKRGFSLQTASAY